MDSPLSRLQDASGQAFIKLNKRTNVQEPTRNCNYKTFPYKTTKTKLVGYYEYSKSGSCTVLLELFKLKDQFLKTCGVNFVPALHGKDINYAAMKPWQPCINREIHTLHVFVLLHCSCDGSMQTFHSHKRKNYQSLYYKEKNCNRTLREDNIKLRKQVFKKDELIYGLEKRFEKEIKLLEKKLLTIECKLQNLRKDYEEILYDHGRILVENAFEINKKNQKEKFHKIFVPKAASTSAESVQSVHSQSLVEGSRQLTGAHCAQEENSVVIQNHEERLVNAGVIIDSRQIIRNDAQNHNSVSGIRPHNISNTPTETTVSTERLPHSVQVHERCGADAVNLTKQPSSLVTAEVFNAYRLLLLTISNWLLRDNITKLTEWAIAKFSVQPNVSVTQIIFRLDEVGVISALDLSPLRIFFETILRYDLMHLIDKFDEGDYSNLRILIYQNQSGRNSRIRGTYAIEGNSRYLPPPRTSVRSETVIQSITNGEVSQRSTTGDDNNRLFVCNNGTNAARTRENQRNEHGLSASDTTVGKTKRENNTVQQHSTLTRKLQNPRHSDDSVHGGEKHSRVEDKWRCGHYKRRCLVKFECCDKYWPCHRCHNNESSCGRRKLKSRDTTMVKCLQCGKEQQFGQYCISCDTKFCDFFCGICKHLTGNDDYPYHCEKCGICRINGDRSFHCDVCGVCLDVQLRGNHKCRPDSAHDECCICLEDAFTGCQILPCSHKVHKECATRMIRSGITRCPICRESFAHKLERRTTSQMSRKKR